MLSSSISPLILQLCIYNYILQYLSEGGAGLSAWCIVTRPDRKLAARALLWQHRIYGSFDIEAHIHVSVSAWCAMGANQSK